MIHPTLCDAPVSLDRAGCPPSHTASGIKPRPGEGYAVSRSASNRTEWTALRPDKSAI